VADEPLVTDTLFLALTRPAMIFGVPLAAALVIATAATLILIIFENPVVALGIGGGLWAVSRLIVRRDANQFRVFSLYGMTKGGSPNAAFWKGSTFAPLPAELMKRKGFGYV